MLRKMFLVIDFVFEPAGRISPETFSQLGSRSCGSLPPVLTEQKAIRVDTKRGNLASRIYLIEYELWGELEFTAETRTDPENRTQDVLASSCSTKSYPPIVTFTGEGPQGKRSAQKCSSFLFIFISLNY